MSKNDDNPLAEQKNAYMQIPVPQTAKKSVEMGIAKARTERRRNMMMKNMKKLSVSAAAVVVAFGVVVNASPVVANAMVGLPVIGSITKVVTFGKYTNEQNNMMADVNIPKVEGDVTANAEIETYAKDLIAKYETELEKTNGEGNYAMQSDYEVVADGKDYVSIRINTVITQASGAQYVKIFTIDKATGETVTLQKYVNDNTKLQAISDNIKQQMEAQMKEDENKSYFIGEDGFNGLTGNESFYLNEAGELVIAFGEYEVAPGSMGTVQFTIADNVWKS